MKRCFLSVLIIALGIHSSAIEVHHEIGEEMIEIKPYVIESDTLNESVEKKKFRLKGEVRMFSSNVPLEEVLIGSTVSGTWIRTDSAGLFEIDLSIKDQLVYFYLDGWSETVVSDYEFKEQHEIKIIMWMHQVRNENVRKPVIYLYSDKVIEAAISVKPVGEFTFTYPEHKDGWKVEVGESGVLTSLENGEKYPYLFWEAENDKLFFQFNQGVMSGFLIKSDTAVSFLEDQLSKIGLNSTEKTDFITYWGPIIEKEEYALIQFLTNEDYARLVGEIEISPKPHALLRVFMLYSGLKSNNAGIKLEDQIFEPFEREGFTVVEWGGSHIDLDIIKP